MGQSCHFAHAGRQVDRDQQGHRSGRLATPGRRSRQGRGGHRRAADREEHGYHRRRGRRVWNPRLARGDRSHNPEGGLAHPHHPSQGRARARDMEGRQEQFVWGLPFVKKVTWTKGLDAETGKPIEYDANKPVQSYVASVTPSRTNAETDICPGNMGGKNWPPTAYNPSLKLWYIPVIESCNHIKVETMTPDKLKKRDFWTGGGPSQPFRITGSVTAIDVTTGKMAGKFETPYPNLGGVLATPDLVFSGQPSGEVMALDGKTLEKLWEFNTGGGVNAPPMTFSVDGKQYVAILVGLGGAWDKWFIDATPELKRMQPGSMLYVFAL